MRSYKPTLAERTKGWLQDAMMAGGAGAYPANHLASGLTSLAGLVPPIGAAFAGSEMGREGSSPQNSVLSALGALPAAKPVAEGAELAWNAVKPVVEDAWKAGRPPTGALVDFLQQHVTNPFKHIAENYPEYDNFLDHLSTKYGDWADIMSAKNDAFIKGSNPAADELTTLGKTSVQDVQASLSDEAIEKHLAKNPWASLADVAGLGPAHVPGFSEAALKQSGNDLKSTDFGKYITPIENWQEQLSSNTPRTNPLEFDTVEARERARSQGYNVDLPLFKGGRWNSYQDELLDPAKKKSWEPGLFFSDDPDIAHSYTYGGAPALPFVARAHNPMEVHWPTATGLDDYNSGHMNAILHAARDKGADMVVVRDMHDTGGAQDQYVVLDPKIVRQPGAEFAPDKMDLAKLAAGIGGVGVVAKAAQNEETK